MEDKETVKTTVPCTQLTDVVVSGGKQYSSPNDLETFYIKLTRLLDFVGKRFNVRETSLDLYLFYLEVTRRGGYHQVGQEKKWSEVVSALKLEGNNATLCAQVENLYGYLLYEFEKLYFYRSPATGTTTGPGKRKRNSCPSLSQLTDDEDYPMAAKISKDYSSQITVFQQAPSSNKEKKKQKGAPRNQSGYQIFLKKECARLKADHRDIGVRKQMAIDAWKKMSDIDKKPYVEESKKIKEKNKEAMIIDIKQKSTQDLKRDEKRPNVCGDY
ncbi:putative high mobility group B protein 11 isoform X2 [Medicago truncatula]|uniref:putative high mobility group B protein 11 isoform X2 n=1 Tax=Medicago truncatula TaxID=3880 RepID=UPI001966E12F|nr:putative high mobility group B protein 11 isoform X2 [Medicago truncatula]